MSRVGTSHTVPWGFSESLHIFWIFTLYVSYSRSPECSCFAAGSLSDVCDPLTGQCPCRPHFHGLNCDKCSKGYWKPFLSEHCEPCGCDPTRSSSDACDQVLHLYDEFSEHVITSNVQERFLSFNCLHLENKTGIRSETGLCIFVDILWLWPIPQFVLFF